MTEGAHQMTSNPLPPAKRFPGSVGIGQGVEVKILANDGSDVRIGSEGEICVRGENVTQGYLNNPEANKSSFTEDGFFRTGDQGKLDQDGYVIITGRIKELINKGGEKISPVEIDNVVTQNSSIAEAVCFAISDEMYGQDIGLAVVLKAGKKITPDDLRKWIATKVAKFKVPKQVRVRSIEAPSITYTCQIFLTDNMPKTATGKVQRRMVAEAMLKQQTPRAKL